MWQRLNICQQGKTRCQWNWMEKNWRMLTISSTWDQWLIKMAPSTETWTFACRLHGQAGENWPEYCMTGRSLSGSKRRYTRPLSDRLWCMGANPGRWRWPTRGRLLPRRWGCFAGSSECRDEITCETKKSDAYYTFHRSTRWCPVAVFVGLDMSRDVMQTTSPAEWWSWQYQVPDDEGAPRRHGTNKSRTTWRASVLPRMWP